MKIAIVFSSRTGNTEDLVKYLYAQLLPHFVDIALFEVDQFPLHQLAEYDGLIIGTYTWGDGEIPPEMLPLYAACESQHVKNMLTGVVGTGDRFYPQFCGAVDEFRDMLYVQSDLALTLKVELSPQSSDIERCHYFVKLFTERMKHKFGLTVR
nr:flavodoxin domain-containing protein [uncultured Bacillus sp.]